MFEEAKGKVAAGLLAAGRFTKHEALRFVNYLFDPAHFRVLLIVLFLVSAMNYCILVWAADTIRSSAPHIISTIVATVTGASTPTTTPTSTSAPKKTTNTPTITLTPALEMITDGYFAALPYPLARYPDQWTVSWDGVRFAAFWEGFSSTPYDDGGQPGVGNCTIGFGHLLHIGPCNGTENMTSISYDQGYKLLEQELNHCGTYVAKYTKVRLTQTQYNIMAGLVCGWGYGKYSQSKVLQYLNRGEYYMAAEELKTTAIYGIGIGLCPGLVRRRKTEAAMFLSAPGFVMWPFVEEK